MLRFRARTKIFDLHEEKQFGGRVWIIFFKDVMSLSMKTDISFKKSSKFEHWLQIIAIYFYMKFFSHLGALMIPLCSSKWLFFFFLTTTKNSVLPTSIPYNWHLPVFSSLVITPGTSGHSGMYVGSVLNAQNWPFNFYQIFENIS